MRRAAGLALLFVQAASTTTSPSMSPSVQTEKQQTLDLQAQAPAYDLTDVSVSFHLRMSAGDLPTCYNDGGKGLWSRDVFRTAVGQAFNTHAAKQREAEAAAGGQSVLINGNWQDATPFMLGTMVGPNPWVPNIYDNIRFDRVVESSYPVFNMSAYWNREQLVKQLWNSSLAIAGLPETYWNVYVRFTLLNVPTSVVSATTVNPLGFRSFITRLAKSATIGTYTGVCSGAYIIPSSVWISTEDNFLPDRVEPVVGRGKKDQTLLIPLIMGLVCMLLVPALVVMCLVAVAQRQNEADVKIAAKEAEVLKHERTVANLNERLAYFHSIEEVATAQNKVRRAQQDEELAYELEEQDVLWKK